MTKRDALIFLFKWKYSLVGLFLLCFGVAAAVIVLVPPGYVASSRLLVERNRAPILRAVMAPGMDMAEALNTESAILSSRTVMAAAVDELRPFAQTGRTTALSAAVAATNAWLEGVGLLYASDPRERWIGLLQKQIKIKPSIDASVLHISYTDTDPQRAAALLNSVMRHYIDHHVRVFSVKGSAELLQQRLTSIDEALRARRADLLAFKKRGAVTAVDDTRRDLVRQTGALGERIAAAQAELDALLTRFEPGHAEVVVAQGKLLRLKQSAAAASDQLSRLEADQARIESMQLDINALELEYRDYAKRYDDARLTDQASATSINVSAVDQATVPLQPQYSRLLLLQVAAVGSLLLALLIAFVREYFDRLLADPATAEDILGVPDLGSVELLPRRALARALPRPGR